MSMYGSQRALNMGDRVGSKGNLTGTGPQYYSQSELVHAGGNGYDTYLDGYNIMNFSKSSGGGMANAMLSGAGGAMMSGTGGRMASSMGGGMASGMGSAMMSGTGGRMMSSTGGGKMSGMGGGMMSGMGGGMASGMAGGMMSGMGGGESGGTMSQKVGGMSASSSIHQKSMILQAQCQEYLMKAEYALQSGSNTGEVEHYMMMAKEIIEQLKSCAVDLRKLGQPNDDVVRTVEICKDQLKGVHMAMTGSMPRRRRSNRGSSGAWEEPGRSFQDAMAWIAQQKRLIETSSWGEDASAIDQQLISHHNFHSSIQRSVEVERATDDLVGSKGDKGNLHALEQEWDSLQKMSFGRTKQLQDLKQIIQDMSKEIMWVNDREEEELMFDWGDKNIDQYIPRKQESYSKLMSALEEKEKDLNKLTTRVDNLLKNNHPASDKIQAYRDTLQTQWSWLLQITKCIDVHLKENAAYNQFFKEADETYSSLQKDHETIRKNFLCDKDTSLENLLELQRGLEREKERIMENKRQVQRLVNKSRGIVRLKPRNPGERSSTPVIVKALCDFKQDQIVICKENEAILKDNTQRSKWDVTGPGGLDMSVPSVCLIVPPPNPHSVSLANKNEQYFDAILSIWNQLYINVKSLIAWQYCLLDIRKINSLTVSMLSKMRPDEYRQLIKSLETRYEEFILNSYNSQMFADDDKRSIENQFNGAQSHYEQLLVQLPQYSQYYHTFKPLIPVTQSTASSTSTSTSSSSRSLTELHALRLRLDGAEDTLSQHVHVCLVDLCVSLQTVQRDVQSMHDEYLRLKEQILMELEGMNDSDKAQFLRSEIGVIDQRLGSLESSSSAYLQRLQALRDLLDSVAQAEDIVKVHEARLTEKETTSLSHTEVEDYMLTLQNVKAELDEKEGVLVSMEADLAKASHWNSQVGGPFQRCDMMLSKYTEHVNLLSDRWRRIHGQIDTRVQDLQLYNPQLQHYKQTSSSLIEWIDATKKKQDALQATKIESIPALTDHIKNQKALNAEIKARRETVESVLKDNELCANAIKDYETDLVSYSSGLETLLNIPIKRTMLKSPSMDLNLEATQLQTRYMELLTHSDDYYKFLGELLKNMEELKIRNTRIDLLEEQLRLSREEIQDRNNKNKSLEETVSSYRVELSSSQNKLLQNNATRDNLDSTQRRLADLNEEVTNLNYLLEEEKTKRRLAEDRCSTLQDAYELRLRQRQEELETVSWSKTELEKSGANKDYEIEKLRQQLADGEARIKELQKEMSKVRSQFSTEISNLKLSYESQIHVSRTDIQRLAAQREDDTADLQLQKDRLEAERRNLEEELRSLQVSLSMAEEHRMRAEEEARSQRAVITEEGRRRRELESQVEGLLRQMDEENSQYTEELAQVMKSLQDKSEELAYTAHSLEEETRRRRTVEEGQSVLEQTMAQLQVKLTSSSMIATQLGECEEELQKMRLELERESRERSRVEQNMSRLQGRMKDLQAVRDGLESQVENLRKANQEEVSRRRDVETELENNTMAMADYNSTITALQQSQEHTSALEKRGEEERLRLQEELERSLRQNKTSAEQITQLSAELKALHQQHLQEQARGKEANLRSEGLYRTIEEKSKSLNENSVELQRLKEMTETQTKERLRLEAELRTTQHDKDELLRSKQGCDNELSSQISSLELQLQASERSNVDYRNLVSELSSERKKLTLETEKIQKQATEVHGTSMLSIQSQYSVIVNERDALLLKLQLSEKDSDRYQRLEEELSRIKLSQDSELHNRQRLQEENERVKRDLAYWKDQYDSKQGLMREYDTEKERLERENNSLKSEMEKLMREHRELGDSYKISLSAMEKKQEVAVINREPPTLDASTLFFDGVRKPVTANQLLDCGVLDKPTVNQLVKGQRTVPDVSIDKKVSLKGTGSIAGVAAGPSGKMSFTEAKTQKVMSSDSANMLLEAQAATGHIIDPKTNQRLTVKEARARGVVDKEDESILYAAEAAAIGYKDPNTGKLLSAGQAMKKGLIDKDTALRLLQAQESVGGILDPVLSIFLSKDIAMDRDLIDEDLYRGLNQRPPCYLDPDTQQATTYVCLKKNCKVDPKTSLLLLPEPKKPLTVQGLRGQVSVIDLVDANLLNHSDLEQLREGRLTKQDIEDRLHLYLRGSSCIAGVYDNASDKMMTIYQAMKNGLLPPETTLKLLEAQAASGFIVDPVTNNYLTVSDAYNQRLFGPEFKDNLLSAERAVTGYRLPGTNKVISLFQAIQSGGLVERDHGLHLLEAQMASGGIIDPEYSHRIGVNIAYKRGHFDKEMNQFMTGQNVNNKGFFDPNTEENLSYLELKKRCITDRKTGLILLPITDKNDQESTQRNSRRKRRVIIVDPETNKEMSVREAYDKGFIDHDTFLELSEQECEWEEITITAPDGSKQFVIIDKKTDRRYDITELLEKRVIDQSDLDNYRSRTTTLAEFAAIIGNKTKSSSLSMTTTRTTTVTERSASNSLGDQAPVGAIFDTDTIEKISISEALNRGLLDSITAQRLLEAQACTGGIIDPKNGHRHSIQEATRLDLITADMASKLKPAQKAFFGFEDVKTRKKMSAAQAVKEGWLPYEAGQRFMEFQFVTGGLYDPEIGSRRTTDDAVKLGWLDERTRQNLHDIRHHKKNLTCPKSKLKISYKDALDNCLVEENSGLKMLQASSVSSRGISSPYNVSSAPGSTSGSRSSSRRSSRRSSVDLGSPTPSTFYQTRTSLTTFSNSTR
uniref:Desmoplakin b n=1 Tax=Gasterosteus aculeatus aculeatus TaxID=481459 RepID=A0AAQ4QV92_GASAC